MNMRARVGKLIHLDIGCMILAVRNERISSENTAMYFEMLGQKTSSVFAPAVGVYSRLMKFVILYLNTAYG